MKPLDFKAFIFDFDGTLYDNSGIAKALILGNPFRFFFMKAERNARRIFKGRDFETPENFKREYYQRAAKDAFTSPATFAHWYEDRYIKRMERALRKKEFHAHPKVDEVFEFLSKAGKKIALYSDYNSIQERALACGIKQESLNLCQGFYSSESFGCLKPAPRAFLQIAAYMETRPKDCLVVGDRDDTDGFGARMSGMSFVQIKTKRPREILDDNHPVMSWEEFAAGILG
ncbi:MAG: HAD family hydrolase [Treponema sp.]|nr:HAD family hydrolase [Treponema sp.]